MPTLQEVVYGPVERLYKLASEMNEDNYASSADLSEQSARAFEIAEIATGLVPVLDGLFEVLTED